MKNSLQMQHPLRIYIRGGAPLSFHPYSQLDFEQDRKLSPAGVFLSGSNFLEPIASFCIADPSQRDIGFAMLSAGTAPTPENYRNCNITMGGVTITFDEYQVAPYAAGAQNVFVQ